MDRETIENELFDYAQKRDCRDLMAAAWHWNDLLERHGRGPRIRKARALIEEALQQALTAVTHGDN